MRTGSHPRIVKCIGQTIAGGIGQDVVEQAENVWIVNRQAGGAGTNLLEHRGIAGVEVGGLLAHKRPVGGAVIIVFRNGCDIGGVGRNQGAAALGVKIGDDAEMIGEVLVDGRRPLRLVGPVFIVWRKVTDVADKIGIADPDDEEAVGGIGGRAESRSHSLTSSAL